MKVLIILGHPDVNSFNHAITQTCEEYLTQKGHKVITHDLYAEKFDPVIYAEEIPKNGSINENIQTHCNDLATADAIIIVHPNWWGQPPAILKGWIDRVIRPGVAYEFKEGDSGEGIPIGLLQAQVAMVFNTSNTSTFREATEFNDPLENLWKNCIFRFCGVNKFARKMFRIVVTSNIEERKQWLEEVRQMLDMHISAE